MTYEQIEAFIAIVSYGSITKAAQSLYTTQSTISTRIQQLESELDICLFLRKRGKRHVELTPHGEIFLPIAERWVALWKDTLALKSRENIQVITIASVDVVNLFALSPFFNECIARSPNTRLDIRTHHSSLINELVEKHVADIGFVYRNSSFPGVTTRPVYKEPMLLVSHRDNGYHDGVRSSSLDPAKEIYLNWTIEWKRWHERNWGTNILSLVTIDSASLLPHYLSTQESWAIAPLSVIEHALAISPDLMAYKLVDPPQPLVCYQLSNRNPIDSHIPLIDSLNHELEEFVRSSSILQPV